MEAVNDVDDEDQHIAWWPTPRELTAEEKKVAGRPYTTFVSQIMLRSVPGRQFDI